MAREGRMTGAERRMLTLVAAVLLIGGICVACIAPRNHAPEESGEDGAPPIDPPVTQEAEADPAPPQEETPVPDPRAAQYARGCERLDALDYAGAYAALAEASGYLDADERRDSIPGTVRGEALAAAGLGEYERALALLGVLEEIGSPDAGETREALLKQEHIEPDLSWYENRSAAPIDRFDRSVTAGDLAETFCAMFLSGETERKLSAGGDDPFDASESQTLVDLALAGYEMAKEAMCEYGAVYEEARVTVWDNGSTVTRMRLATNDNNPCSDDELRSHVEQLHAYCERTLRELNDALRIGASMTRAQKARVLYEYVCELLDYDEAHRTHDPYIALQSRTGVCESYVSIYHCLCEMAGIPSRAQVGDVLGSDETHIWSVQTAEDGSLRYTDCTWGDAKSTSAYCWSDTLWSTHRPHRPA